MLPLFLLYVGWRGVRDRRYFRRLGERFGLLPPQLKATPSGAIWLHAVSVGEVLSAVTLLRAFRIAIPHVPIFVSCTTLAGRDVAGQKLAGIADGVFFAPVDYVWAVRRVLRTIRPRLVVVMETEIWPNLWNEAKRCGAALLIVNGRISDRAFPRYLELRLLFEPVLRLPDRILAQSAADRERYQQLGATAENAGNLKYDVDPRAARVAPELRAWCGGADAIWIAASTMPPSQPSDPDEDEVVLDAWEQVRAPGRRLIIAPRRPERFESAAEKLRARGIEFVRRSELQDPGTPVLLLDSMGELAPLFRFATVVFMGGTLASRGGHNVLEPAAFGKPVIVGPHMENFRSIAAKFASASALVEIAEAAELAAAVERGFRGELARVGDRAELVAASERGATERAVAAARELHAAAIPHVLPYGPLHPILRLLSLAWVAGTRLKRQWTTPQRLGAPVISVGGITIGGAGKTPLVRLLARRLHEAGYQPAILTRGYRRQSSERITIVPAGASAATGVTGDEAQLFVRDGYAHVGIGADRAAVGRTIEEQLRPDVFLLDDGFQHCALARDLDIVVLDPLDPHGGGEVFPLGRLREPASALARADLVIQKRLHPRGWIPALPSNARLNAVCGIANPASFWRTLDELGVAVERRYARPDHHPYTAEELRRIAAGADGIVTTEKDRMNMPDTLPVPVYYVEMDFQTMPEVIVKVLHTARGGDLINRRGRLV
ncbi:MAG TPA: tetraacyldisaccharide 4'-kinase [Bryobacteraceae bacterium]|nr:tetraacyldisaccharide 4'-kinase [Bryobacteraceae bacterium]